MSVITRFFRRNRKVSGNDATVFERARLARTMPGETAARAGSRYGFLIN
ncbi:hypothetical protein [Oricola cellulosilytica]|nr:hypothetical protein [Oricola cellulosilytica]